MIDGKGYGVNHLPRSGSRGVLSAKPERWQAGFGWANLRQGPLNVRPSMHGFLAEALQRN
jgi:hypothetical protein